MNKPRSRKEEGNCWTNETQKDQYHEVQHSFTGFKKSHEFSNWW
jgi:hypothetical protein